MMMIDLENQSTAGKILIRQKKSSLKIMFNTEKTAEFNMDQNFMYVRDSLY